VRPAHAASRVNGTRQLRFAFRSRSHRVCWRPGRVYFLTILEPSRDDRTPALTARSASHMPPYGAKNPRSTYLQLMPRLGVPPPLPRVHVLVEFDLELEPPSTGSLKARSLAYR
jgi:hypothetical protein